MAPHFAETKHIMRDPAGGYEFNHQAAEIAILDQRGSPIWTKRKPAGAESEPIHWNGVDIWGQPVDIGSYVCKIVFMNGQTVYVPFVFMK